LKLSLFCYCFVYIEIMLYFISMVSIRIKFIAQ